MATTDHCRTTALSSEHTDLESLCGKKPRTIVVRGFLLPAFVAVL